MGTQQLYNVVVISAGTAGLVTAAGTVGLGGRATLIEQHKMGRDCLNYDSIPSKADIPSARVTDTIGKALPSLEPRTTAVEGTNAGH